MNLKHIALVAFPLCLGPCLSLSAATRPIAGPEAGFVTLPGHVPAAVRTAQDLGPVLPDKQFSHLMLQLKRSPEGEKEVADALDALQRPGSPTFHKWMAATEFGRRFGATDEQIAQVSDWLRSHGLTVEGTNDARTAIQFSGKAAQMEAAFHAGIHNLAVNGRGYVSNVRDPQIPVGLAAIVKGVPMSDFMPHPLYHGAASVRRDSSTQKLTPVGKGSADLTASYGGRNIYAVAPADFAKIYNLTPLWDAGFRGAGQTVAVVEDSFMKTNDVASFRKAFGLSGYAGTFVQEAPVGAHPCANPGITGAETEAALDAQWAGATAPDAHVVLAACADTQTQFGGLIAMLNLLSQKNPPQTISISYGYCEAYMGAIQLHQFATTFQQAVAEGVSVFVSSGDEGAASCDANRSYAQHGIATSGFTTTPYDVSVGGTDFFDVAQGTVDKYWSSTNSPTFASALSYIPEKTWNNACTDSDLLELEGFAVAYGANGLCNNAPGYNWVTTGSGSGGPSSVYSKPLWQNVYGVPADAVRDIPDVSLFSASGFYGHALVFCNSDKAVYGVPCDFSDPSNAVYNVAGGTSFASPALAGIFTLISQKYGRQGNPNPGLYTLGAKEYGLQGAPKSALQCDSTLGSGVNAACTFYDVRRGNIDVPCIGTVNCFGSEVVGQSNGVPSFNIGALSADTTQFTAAYPATAGWDMATGLGTINAANLFTSWSAVSLKPATSKLP